MPASSGKMPVADETSALPAGCVIFTFLCGGILDRKNPSDGGFTLR
jgi:hypothetical protein